MLARHAVWAAHAPSSTTLQSMTTDASRQNNTGPLGGVVTMMLININTRKIYLLTIIYRCQFGWLVHLLRFSCIYVHSCLVISNTFIILINNISWCNWLWTRTRHMVTLWRLLTLWHLPTLYKMCRMTGWWLVTYCTIWLDVTAAWVPNNGSETPFNNCHATESNNS